MSYKHSYVQLHRDVLSIQCIYNLIQVILWLLTTCSAAIKLYLVVKPMHYCDFITFIQQVRNSTVILPMESIIISNVMGQRTTILEVNQMRRIQIVSSFLSVSMKKKHNTSQNNRSRSSLADKGWYSLNSDAGKDVSDCLTIAYCQHVSCSLSPATQQYGGGGDGRR